MRLSVLSAALTVAVGAAPTAVGQEPSSEELVVLQDDSHMARAPDERRRGPNPTAEHVALMETLNGLNVSAETERLNRLEDARRIADVDLYWGLR